MNTPLLRKYNVPGPRYTSYPTVPFWQKTPPTPEQWLEKLTQQFEATNLEKGISLYLHLPFCETLCTYCGCHTRITKNHGVERPYLEALFTEWNLYKKHFSSALKIKEIHLGGGTPTFFQPENLGELIDRLLENTTPEAAPEFSFEGHPRNTTKVHLAALAARGFSRVSLGIQDFDPKVQTAIHRFQTLEDVQRVTDEARALGYSSINYDLIYGLPFQRLQGLEKTFDEVLKLRPERIAFYSYAYVPWLKPGQRLFGEQDLPSGEEKRALYEMGRQRLEDAGYLEIGMDHFALPDDPLAVAWKNEKLHRNFMGYTTTSSEVLLGLGVSSISDSWTAFAQNEKKVETYYKLLEQKQLPIFKGHLLSEQDLHIRQHILDLMCHFYTRWEADSPEAGWLVQAQERLQEMEQDGLISLQENEIRVHPHGRGFVRNVCMALDRYLWDKKPNTQLFSMTI